MAGSTMPSKGLHKKLTLLFKTLLGTLGGKVCLISY